MNPHNLAGKDKAPELRAVLLGQITTEGAAQADFAGGGVGKVFEALAAEEGVGGGDVLLFVVVVGCYGHGEGGGLAVVGGAVGGVGSFGVWHVDRILYIENLYCIICIGEFSSIGRRSGHCAVCYCYQY